MLIKVSKKELCSLLGTEVVSLKPFTDIKWAEDGMVLSVSRTLFLGSLKVKIKWPCELAKHQTNKEQIQKALTHLFAQVDERYEKAVEEMEKVKADKTEAPAPAPAQA